MDRQGSR
ncbi:hypothetical protein BIW11_13255 [Tropilaelaps mercedesae]|nr:hypothetical protein BIW11_13255 [Tropilaelaps mercedesae]